MMRGVRPVCVIGLGLIGGSVLRAAAASGRDVWGATASASDGASAAGDGFRVEATVRTALRKAAEEDAIVVLAVPLPAVRDVLESLAEHAPYAMLTDVVSVKQPVVDMVRHLAPWSRYVGGHPMAGTSSSGWTAGSASLFADAAWVLTVPEQFEAEQWLTTAQLVLDCGAHVVPTDPAEHDQAVARISHVPHILAAVLAAVGADGGPLAMALAAGSFTDATRVAATDPNLVRAMCEGNRAALLPALDDALGRLGAARGSLASTGGLKATLDAGNVARGGLEESHGAARTTVRLDVSAPSAVSALLGLGARGGRIVGLDGTTAIAEVPTES